MKKIFVIILVLTMVVCFVGCNKLGNDNFPATVRGSLIERWNAANLALAESSVDNAAALQREAELIAYTADKGKAFSVVLLVHDKTTDTVFLLPEIAYRLDHANAYEYRELCKADLITQAVASSNELFCTSGTILGAIVHWESANSWGNKSYYSICDFDFDGTWDYATKNPSEFDIMHFAINEHEPDGSGPSQTIGGYNTVELSTCASIRFRSEIVSLSELSGDEVFKDFEKLLNKTA